MIVLSAGNFHIKIYLQYVADVAYLGRRYHSTSIPTLKI